MFEVHFYLNQDQEHTKSEAPKNTVNMIRNSTYSKMKNLFDSFRNFEK